MKKKFPGVFKQIKMTQGLNKWTPWNVLTPLKIRRGWWVASWTVKYGNSRNVFKSSCSLNIKYVAFCSSRLCNKVYIYHYFYNLYFVSPFICCLFLEQYAYTMSAAIRLCFLFTTCPVSWWRGCKIYRMHLWRRVRLPQRVSWYMTLKNLMVRLQECRKFGECIVPLHCNHS